MKKYLNFLFLTICVFSIGAFISSCRKIDGQTEIPKFDPATHIFSNAQVDTIIRSKNDVSWWFAEFGLYINGEMIDFEGLKVKSWRDPAPVGSDSGLGEVSKFESEWFTIEKLNNREISIALKKNEGDKKRDLKFAVTVGNGQQVISLEQKSEPAQNTGTAQ